MAIAGTAASLLATKPVEAQPEWAGAFCRDRACVFVEADASLKDEAEELVKTLQLRMCGHGLAVFEAPFPLSAPEKQDKRDCTRPDGPFRAAHWWTVYLKSMVTGRMLAVIDHLGRRSDEDVVRDLPRGPDAQATAWTIVLAVEEAVSSYLEAVPDSAALGSGLALVEPPEIGGPPSKPKDPPLRYPRFSSVRMGAGLYYLDAVRAALAGPRLAMASELSPHVSLTLGAGWVGLGQIHQGDLDGTVSHIPLDLLFVFKLLSERFFHLELELGMSAGFAIYQTSLGSQRRTDILFNPWLLAGIRLEFDLFGPLRLDLVPAAAMPILHDVLRNGGTSVYRQDWVLPSIAIDLVLSF